MMLASYHGGASAATRGKGVVCVQLLQPYGDRCECTAVHNPSAFFGTDAIPSGLIGLPAPASQVAAAAKI